MRAVWRRSVARSSRLTGVRSNMLKPIHALLVIGVVACTAEKADTPPATGTPGGASSHGAASPVAVQAERDHDLTGDGRAERIIVDARGPAYDSLTVRLEVRSASDSLLYATRWSSRDYFKYDYRQGKPDSVVQRIVRDHLRRLLADSAFSPAGTLRGSGITRLAVIDTGSIRYDIASQLWRRAHSWPDSTPLPPRAEGELRPADVPTSRVSVLASELRAKPTFTYHAGGELTYTIAWSDREQRFVTVASCC